MGHFEKKVLSVLCGVLLLTSTVSLIMPTQNVSAVNDTKTLETREGYFNILIIDDFLNKTSSEEYYLFADENGKQKTYKLEFGKIPDSIKDLSGKNVKVKGFKKIASDTTAGPLGDSEVIDVESFVLVEQSQGGEGPAASQSGTLPVPSPLITHAILLQYPNFPTLNHNQTHFENRFYDPNDSLAAYWYDNSYGALTIPIGTVVDWQLLSQNDYEYACWDCLNQFAANTLPEAVTLADPYIDFNGPDNIIQNSSPSNLRVFGDNGDDVDELLLIFNSYVRCFCAFTFSSPSQITTNEGTLWVNPIWLPDLSDTGGDQGFAVGKYQKGYGVPAHEMGHTFGWEHTPPVGSSDPYADPWSVMSGRNDLTAPAGVISYQKSLPAWFSSNDTNNVVPKSDVTFNLDFLHDPSPSSDYLMGIVPNDPTGNTFFTLEARKNSLFDHTPQNKTALMIYQVNGPCPQGCTVNTGGFALGNSWNDTQNKISVTYLSNTTSYITVRVTHLGYLPVANGQTVAITNDLPINITMTASDGDNDSLTFSIVTFPTRGQLSPITPLNSTAAVVTYTPNTSSAGLDSFTFKVNDGTFDSNVATVSIIKFTDEQRKVGEWKFEDNVLDTSGFGNNGTIVGNPFFVNGKLARALNFTGSDYVNLGNSPSLEFSLGEPFSVSMWIKPVLPQANFVIGDSYVGQGWQIQMQNDNRVEFKINGGNSAIYKRSLTSPLSFGWTHIAATWDGNSQIKTYVNGVDDTSVTSNGVFYDMTPDAYEPKIGNVGDQFSPFNGPIDNTRIYRKVLTTSEIQNLFNEGNSPPIANNQSLTIENMPLNITLTGSDLDGNALTFFIVNNPMKGQLSQITTINATAASVTFTPNSNFVGSDSFTFRAFDGALYSNNATVNIVQRYLVGEWKFEDNVLDTSGFGNNGTIVGNPFFVNGKLARALNFTGSDYVNLGNSPSLEFSLGEPFSVSTWINPVLPEDIRYIIGDSYVGQGWHIRMAPNNSVEFLINGGNSNIYKRSLTSPLSSGWTHLVATWNGSSQIKTYVNGVEDSLITSNGVLYDMTPDAYEPKIGNVGDQFYPFNGPIDNTRIYRKVLTTSEIQNLFGEGNVPPNAVNDSATTNEDTVVVINVLVNDSDPDNGTLTVQSVTTPANGTATINVNQTITYTPNLNFHGVNSFNYTISDGSGGTDTATVTVTVNPVNDDAMVAYRSNTGTNGLSSPKVKIWGDSGLGTYSNEIELPTAGSPIRHLVLKHYATSDKNVLVTQSDDGMLDAYVCTGICSQASSWVVTNNIAQVSSTAANERRFDVDFESSTGDVIVVYAVLNSDTTRDLAYKVLPAAVSSFSGIAEQYIDDTSTNGGNNLQYSWIALDRDPVSTSQELILVGFDSSGNDVNAWVWSGSAWGSRNEITASASATGGGEALATTYSTDGSKALVLSGSGNQGTVATIYWDGTAWVDSPDFDVDSSDQLDAKWITLKADPASDDLQTVIIDSGSDLATAYWSGTGWSMTSNIDTAVDVNSARPADFAWNPTGSTGKLVWDTDTSGTTLSQRTCSPQCSGSTTTISSYSGSGSWITLTTNPDSADTVDILGLRLNNAFDIGSFRWDGSNFANYGDSQITTDTTITTFQAYSIEFTQ